MSEFDAWWREGVFYHIYLRSFADSDGDGLGDIQGLIRHLDHLKGSPDSLNIDAIWISPCYPSPDKDFGYDVADYTAIDPRYGSLADFDQLLKEAHQRGIRVLLDLVFNHTSDRHPWFQESRQSRQSKKRDWYIWRDPQPGKRPPNNWESVFGGKAWTWDEHTGQYYLHMFLKEQPDLNWRNPQVRKALMGVMRFWLDRGVDGFRLDVFNMWFKHPNLLDNPPKLGLRGFDRQRHLYDVDQPEMLPALQEMRSVLNSYPGSTAVGEPFGRNLERITSYCSQERLPTIFNFDFTDSPWNPKTFLRSIQRWESALSKDAWPSYALNNHDISRAVTRYRGQPREPFAKVAAALLLTLRGTPFIYYGQEIGMPDLPLRRNQIVDYPGRRYWPFYKGRDVARGPMQWDDTNHAGFTVGEPWLPVHPDYPNCNAAHQRSDPHSVFSFYRSLIKLRRSTPALRKGTFQPLQTNPKQGMAFLRLSPEGRALIGLNFRHRSIRLNTNVNLTDTTWMLALSSNSAKTAEINRQGILLGPHEAAIFLEKTGPEKRVPEQGSHE